MFKEGFKERVLVIIGLLATVGLALACGGGGGGNEAGRTDEVSGTVSNEAGVPVTGATVYFVPASQIDTTQILASAVRSGESESYDEPLEDLVSASGDTFTKDQTDSSGNFAVTGLAAGDYYIYVKPSDTDTEHLPGGSYSRIARSDSVLNAAPLTINVSSKPSSSATYIGTSACLVCHPERETLKKTAHKLGISVTGVEGPLQDVSNYPDFNDSLANFVFASAYTSGTVLELGDYDSTRSFDKFKVRVQGDTTLSITTVYARFYLWKNTADSKYYITVVNALNGGDANSPLHLPAEYTYGGTVYKQRFLVKPPSSLTGGVQRKGVYPLLQYNTEGSDSRFERTRRVWRDYKFADWWNKGPDSTYGTADDYISAISVTKTFQGECAACHFTGYSWYTDGTTGEYLANAVDDAQGESDIDGDGNLDDMNIGCEVCHGPGSQHQSIASGRYIVSPQLLSPERENMICGRCHDRPKGQGTVVNEQPLNTSNQMMLPGESRTTFLSDYCSSTQKGPASTDIWSDDIHSKSHHQQHSDFLKSSHYKNDRQLVVCSDCHDMHGEADYEHELKYDPDDNGAGLCAHCHSVNIITHMEEKTGSAMSGDVTKCRDCHMPTTARTGAGKYGYLLSTPPYTSSDDEKNKAYWVNDVTSHVFAVPLKSHIDVVGDKPGNAMSIPYTNSCGTCHDPSNLQYLKKE